MVPLLVAPMRKRLLLLLLLGFLLLLMLLMSAALIADLSVHNTRERSMAGVAGGWRRRFQRISGDDALLLGFQYGKVWKPVHSLRQLFPHAAPRGFFPAPNLPGNGFLFATISGEYHEIHASICDFVVIARLLNATLVIPKIDDAEAAKGSSSTVGSFSYLYNEQHFISSLVDDVRVVRSLPKELQSSTSMRRLSVKTPSRSASVEYYLDEVLPELRAHRACGLVFSNGGGLQSLLPAELVEYQRLRCRVAFHALRFRHEIQELGFRIVRRLQEQGRSYVVVHFGLERDVLAHHGCAELFQDLQTESIQSQRAVLLKTRRITGELWTDSSKQRRRGLCPLMPAEVGILLQALGFQRDTKIYLAGTETMGGQRLLLSLRSVYHNLEDRFSLSTDEERAAAHGVDGPPPAQRPASFTKTQQSWLWATKSERSQTHSKDTIPVEGWWRSVGDCGYETEDVRTVALMERQEEEGRRKLLWGALDHLVSLEANTFFPAFDRDRHGHPNAASLIMGHRFYASASLKTFRPNRSTITGLLDKIQERPHAERQPWMLSARRSLMRSLTPEALAHASLTVKPDLFLAHPLPECGCRTGRPAPANATRYLGPGGRALWGGEDVCPGWTDTSAPPPPRKADKKPSAAPIG